MGKTKKVALVTGGGQGIGRATLLQLANDGHDVVINDLPHNRDKAETIVDQIRTLGQEAIFLPADVGDRDEMEKLFSQTLDHFGRIDVAVANAAFQKKTRITELDWPTAKRIFEVTQFGVFHVAQLAAQQMIRQREKHDEQNCRIILVGSIHAEMAIPFHGPYSMAKAAGNQLCKTLAAELARFKITVNAINPGWIDTEGERQYITDQELKVAANELPWKRLGAPEEIAKLVSFLVSDNAEYITGTIHTMDGGLRLDQAQITRGLD